MVFRKLFSYIVFAHENLVDKKAICKRTTLNLEPIYVDTSVGLSTFCNINRYPPPRTSLKGRKTYTLKLLWVTAGRKPPEGYRGVYNVGHSGAQSLKASPETYI